MSSTATTIAAVEHYVTYWLAARGFNVTMIRSLSNAIDLLVSAQGGSHSLTLQVRSSENAHRRSADNPGLNRSEWEIPWPGNAGPGFFHAFVDLREGSGKQPEVFIVPSEKLERVLSPFARSATGLHKIWIDNGELLGDSHGRALSRMTYLENYGLIEEALGL